MTQGTMAVEEDAVPMGPCRPEAIVARWRIGHGDCFEKRLCSGILNAGAGCAPNGRLAFPDGVRIAWHAISDRGRIAHPRGSEGDITHSIAGSRQLPQA